MKYWRILLLATVLIGNSTQCFSQKIRLSASFGYMRELGKTAQNDLIQEEKDPTFQFATCIHYLLPKKRFVILGWQNHGYGISFSNSLGIPASLLSTVARFETFELGYGIDAKKLNKRDHFRLISSIQFLLNDSKQNQNYGTEEISIQIKRSGSMVPILSNVISFVHQASKRIQTKASARVNLGILSIRKFSFVVDNGFEERTFNSKTTANSLSLEYGLIY